MQVCDDGRGFDLESIQHQARRRHLPVPQDDQEAARLVFLAGFSTTEVTTEVSGRGIGLDVVKSQIETLHGLDYIDTYLQCISRVTADDIAEVCSKYLNENNRTVGQLFSDGSGEDEEVDAVETD